MQMFIVRATSVTDELMDAITHLMPQLKLRYLIPTRAEVEALLASKASILITVRYPDKQSPIVGMLTLIIYQVPSGVRAHVEDIVVDEAARDQGIGEALVRHALGVAREAGANGVALTTNPRREVANRLYQRIGFKRWETNIYFYEF
jgi:ribosomal protein S18 acetylase RimI-like enzyme